MDEQRINNQLENITNHLMAQNETLVRLTVSVEEHIRRTNLLEDRADRTDAKIDERADAIDAKLLSHDAFIQRGKGAFWVLGLIASAFVIIFKYFKSN